MATSDALARYVSRLDALRKRLGGSAIAPNAIGESLVPASAKSDKSPVTAADAVAWRVEVMRAQVPARGPIPLLMARPEASTRTLPGRCGSCGDPKEIGQWYVCRACQAAKGLALEGAS
jgi:hypothetical protein